MDENARRVLRRSGWVLLGVGLLSSLGVFLGHEWFHRRVLPFLGIGSALGDALGGLAIILVAFVGQRLASLAIFRDIDFGLLRILSGLLLENRDIRHELDTLDRQANLDRLTGCWTRHRLEEAVQAEMDRLARYDQSLSLLLIDADHFKRVNDRHGRSVGDKILLELANHLRRALRTPDLLARWEGATFLVLCPNTSLTTAVVLAERLREKIAAVDFETADPVSISIGVAECLGGESWEQWLARADAVLLRAKGKGRNRVEFAPESRVLAGMLDRVAGGFVKLHWHSAYACGNATIDREHQILFGLANELLNAMIAAKPAEETRAIIQLLLREIVLHFENEEAILAAAGYPGLAEHAATHRKLVDRAARLAREFDASTQDIGDLFQYLVHEVVARHLLVDDCEYFPYLAPAG